MTKNAHPAALITGCNGFVGAWLIKLLHAKGFTVHGIDIQPKPSSPDISYHPINLLDSAAVSRLVTDLVPGMIFNLAAVSFLPDTARSPRKSIECNLSGAMVLLDAVKNCSPSSRLLLVGSSKEYGGSICSDNVGEDVTPQPADFYGISKYACELTGLQYARQFGIDVRCVRSFNHTGPGQSQRFVCSDWARQAAAIALGEAEPVITVGDIDLTIDFSDVRDVVEAYLLVLEKGACGEVYNVCSGSGVELSWILGYLADKSSGPVTVKHLNDKKRANKSSVRLIGNHDKLTLHTGWKPAITLEQTLDELFEWWLRSLSAQEKQA